MAEGVESNQELNILKKLGCDWIQGYLLSKPVLVEDFEKKYKKWSFQAGVKPQRNERVFCLNGHFLTFNVTKT